MKRIFLFFALLLCIALASRALMVQGYDPAVNDRFASGYPNSPVPNKDPKFIGKDFDWSGVGWWRKDAQYAATLISSRNFIYTKHNAPQIGDTITFFGRDGALHDFHVAKLQMVEIGKNGSEPLYADAGVGTFEETVALSDQVCHYPVAVSDKGVEPFVGRKILHYGHMARIGTNEILEGMMLPGVGSEFNTVEDGLSNGMARSETGDSGSPSFLVIGGKLAIVGTIWREATDCMVSGLAAQMNAIMAADGEKLETVPLDEPGK